ncbi:MAG: hypothetical protein GC161_12045 [Planctomycetaceae bacterium]|nr:hypothetical protein [Planctomycetaceae bacterium]
MEHPALESGETLRFHAPAIKGAVARTGPTFRATVNIPVIQDLDLFITDRRIIVRAELFLGLFESDYVAWFPGTQRPVESDVLTAAYLTPDGPMGPHLTLVAQTGRPSLLRGPELKLALYLPNATAAAAALPPGLSN